MRSVLARRAATIGSAALLLLTPTVALTHAEPAPAAPSATTSLPPELVAAIQRDLGLTAEQYLTQADTGQQLAVFANTLREKYPDAFAGAWLDPAGSPLVGLADGKGKDDARKAAEELGYRTKDAPRSERALGDQLNRAQDWVSTLPTPLARLIGATGVDVVNNHLVMQVSDTATGLGLQLPDFLETVDIAEVPGLGSSDPGSSGLGSSDLGSSDLGSTAPQPIDAPGGIASQGGDSYAAGIVGSNRRCSLGFNGTNGTGDAVNISAGHCDPNRGTAGTPNASITFDMHGSTVLGDRFGTVSRSRFDSLDYSVIRIDDNTGDRFRNNLVRVPGAASLAIDGTGEPVVGAPSCLSGITSGYRCGTVTGTDVTIELGATSTEHNITTSICALSGTSGGPLVTGTRALGIVSSVNHSMANCGLATVATFLEGTVPTTNATPINEILRDNPGLSVNTR